MRVVTQLIANIRIDHRAEDVQTHTTLMSNRFVDWNAIYLKNIQLDTEDREINELWPS